MEMEGGERDRDHTVMKLGVTRKVVKWGHNKNFWLAKKKTKKGGGLGWCRIEAGTHA